jgi:hypothetical protein
MAMVRMLSRAMRARNLTLANLYHAICLLCGNAVSIQSGASMKFLSLMLLIVVSSADFGQQPVAADSVCTPCVYAHEDFLASDAMGGRGSGTHDELVAAEYVASDLMQYGIEPAAAGNGDPSAGELGEYIQPVQVSLNVRGELRSVSTRNVLGILRGSDPRLANQVVLLSAHLDHLGTIPSRAARGDAIFNGADDDASGVTAVLELARALAARPRPKRTVMFALFGSEELGDIGSNYFLEHPPLPLEQIVANLEFEMIGRSDPVIAPHTLWLTGYERTDLGPELVKHGAPLVADPRPTQNFFWRSDNFALAKKGIVAQTVSSFGLHKDYHQPSDDIAHLDLGHMVEAIGSMIAPVGWLVNSDFVPHWLPGKKP